MSTEVEQIYDPNNPHHNPDHIDRRVPPKIHRLVHHYHNLIYIRDYFDRLGQPPPQWIVLELQRVDKEAIKEIERERQQGGLLRRELEDDAGSRKDDTIRPQDGAGVQGGQSGRRRQYRGAGGPV